MKQRKFTKLQIRGLVLLFLVITSCSNREVFSEFRSFPQGKWDQQEALRFEVPVKDVSAHYDIFFEIRNNNEYPFRNIWLFVNYQTPRKELRSDTLQVELADAYGKWYGKGLSLFTYSFPYELNVQYSDTGIYTYTVFQGMRENPLKGISDVGLKILKKID